ncbi:MAG TPA: DUF2795 domain-containing protein [Amycolatopsis sp.]|nr:DUF2795 domain-containing protein [Amycolatopsis sp.]
MTQPDRDTLAHYLASAPFPCERGELLRHAAAGGAGDGLLGELGGLPPGTSYPDVEAVWHAVDALHTEELP